MFKEDQIQFANEYFDIMSLCHEKITQFPHETKPSYLNLSTMTMVCDLTKSVDILQFSENFVSPLNIKCTIKKPKSSKEFDITKRGKKKKTFFNQASIHFTTHTTKCVKVFSNGRLHITGVTSMIEASEVCCFTCKILNKTTGAIVGGGEINAVDLKICMINTNFSLNHGIDIIALKSKLQECVNITCTYTPDTYPGLKIKYIHNESKNKSSIFIFSSGQIVITGVKFLTDVQEVFKCLIDIISECVPIVYKSHITIKKKSVKQSYKYGYDVQLLMPCFSLNPLF
jgi:TATA-box binding protein (TBP) (component of TFIID and TFIIIB)